MQYGGAEEIMEEQVDREGRKGTGEVKRIGVFLVGFAVSTGVVARSAVIRCATL